MSTTYFLIVVSTLILCYFLSVNATRRIDNLYYYSFE